MPKKYLLLFIIFCLGAFLRLYRVPADPPGLYIDEISIAYNANEIITKGVDQYGVKYPLWFRAFGEYKMPIPIYLVAGSIAVLGRTDFAVRLPFIICGILTLLVFYFFIERLGELNKKYLPFAPPKLALLATLFLAISPWHIQFSRAGFEATIALFLFLLGLLFITLAYQKKQLLPLILSSVFLVLTMYTYNIYRFIAPITFLVGLGIFVKNKNQRIRSVIFCFLIFAVLIIPVLIFSLTGAGTQRFTDVSAFASYANLPLLQKIIQYPMVFLNNYLSYFSLQFLFVGGDGIGRHQIPNFGPMQFWELPFLIIGLFFFIKNLKKPFFAMVLSLLLIAPLVAAFAVPSPHTLRSLPMVIPLTVIVAYGFLWVLGKILKGKRVIFLFVIIILIVYEYLLYLHFYYQHYPVVNSLDWGAGNEQMVMETVRLKPEFKHIVIDSHLGALTIPLYFGFYTNDSFEPLMVSNSWQKPKSWPDGSTLYIRSYYGEKSNPKIIDTVYLPGKNKDAFAQFWKL